MKSTTGKEREVAVSKWIIHESYTSSSHYKSGDDIAILKLATPINEEAHIKYTTLPTLGEPTQAGSRCTVVGWGSLSTSGSNGARQLQKADLDVRTWMM